MNNEALHFFEKLANNENCSPVSVKLVAKNDFTELDAAYIMKYADAESEILDLASGSGMTVKQLYRQVKSIVAVEKFSNFARFIERAENIVIVIDDITTYVPKKQFDLITCFGIMHYFDANEAEQIYRKYHNYLKKNGKILIKNQFGIQEDVLINSFSEELQQVYYSMYRTVENEIALLEKCGFTNCQVTDIYPPEANRWKNTHFYAIAAEKQ